MSVKTRQPFNIRLNNHRKDSEDPKAILVDKHFQKTDLLNDLRFIVHYRFNEHARFTIIDRLTNTNFNKEILRECLIQRGNFRI